MSFKPIFWYEIGVKIWVTQTDIQNSWYSLRVGIRVASYTFWIYKMFSKNYRYFNSKFQINYLTFLSSSWRCIKNFLQKELNFERGFCLENIWCLHKIDWQKYLTQDINMASDSASEWELFNLALFDSNFLSCLTRGLKWGC